MAGKKVNLTPLCIEYDKLRTKEGKIKKEKDEIGIQIKAAFGDRLDLPNLVFKLAYHYDDDQTTYTIDHKAFKKAEPKIYKKWVHVETIPGARRLQVTRLDQEK